DAPANRPSWTYAQDSDQVVVTGVTWPNLNVDRHQYRFRLLMASNNELFDYQFINFHGHTEGTDHSDITTVPFTIIGSDGGYLPAPQTVTDVQLGITERADILVDFSQFTPGTKITLVNSLMNPGDSLYNVMQFTVVDNAGG